MTARPGRSALLVPIALLVGLVGPTGLVLAPADRAAAETLRTTVAQDASIDAAVSPAPSTGPGAGDLTRITAVPESTETGCVRTEPADTTVTSVIAATLAPATVWPLSRGAGVSVAVLDTGIDPDVRQLGARVRIGPDQVPGYAGDQDCLGHGTFVASLIAAAPRDTSTVVGVAPAARIHAIRVTDDSGGTSPDVLARGIRAALAAGDRIIDVSVVSATTSPALEAAVRSAVGHSALLIAPAAADDQELDGPVYPAALEGVISVADAQTAASADTDLAVTPDLTAPGQAVIGLAPGGGPAIGTGHAYAAAVVAATAALVDAYRPGLSLDERTGRLLDTAYPVTAGTGVSPGSGLVDPVRAVTAVQAVTVSGGGSVDLTAGPALARIDRTEPVPAQQFAWRLIGFCAAVFTVSSAVLLLTRARSRRGAQGGGADPHPLGRPSGRIS